MSFRRIVLAIAAPGPTAAMTTAVELAGTMNVDLVGLFVESTELITLAMLPGAGEVGFPGAARRALDLDAMERGLRAQARRAERELAALAADRRLRWTFDVVRGRLSAELFARAEQSDLAVVPLADVAGGAPASPARALRAYRGATVPLLLVGERTRRLASIAVVAPPTADPDELAEIVAALAPRYGSAVLFVAVGPAPQDRGARQDRLEQLLRARGLAGRFRRIAQALDAPALVAMEPARVVVILTASADACEDVLDALGCPVLLLPSAARRDAG